MRILVTGGAGFIGSAVCRHLIQETNAEVVNVDKLTYAGNPNSLKMIDGDPRYRFVKSDICDETGIAGLFAETVPDGVINVAAESHVDRSITGSRSFIETNIIGTYTLLEAARRYWSGLSDEAKGKFPLPSCLHRRSFMVRLARMGFLQNQRPTIPHRLIRHRKLHRIRAAYPGGLVKPISSG